MDDERLKNLGSGGYFKELFELEDRLCMRRLKTESLTQADNFSLEPSVIYPYRKRS